MGGCLRRQGRDARKHLFVLPLFARATRPEDTSATLRITIIIITVNASYLKMLKIQHKAKIKKIALGSVK